MMRLISAWWHKMTNGIGEDRIIVHYNAEQAIDLEELSGSFARSQSNIDDLARDGPSWAGR